MDFRWPSRPKPVTSVQAFTPTFIIASAAARFSSDMLSTAPCIHIGGTLTLLAAGGDDSGSQGFGQNQGVAGAGAGVGHVLAGIHQPDDRKAVLGLGVVDGVAPDNQAARFGCLVMPSTEYLFPEWPCPGLQESRRCSGPAEACRPWRKHR